MVSDFLSHYSGESLSLSVLAGNALATVMDMLVPTFIHKKYKQALHAFDLLVWNTREIIRPGRSNPRNKKPKKPYSMNYKRL
jgi:hypothetical protein